MLFKALTINDFRNFKKLQVEFSPGLNIFIGQNGQGKTNLLEALYLLGKGESFRFAQNMDLVRQGTSRAIIRAQIENADSVASEVAKTKIFYLNEKKTSAQKLQAHIPIILFSPESLAAVKEGDEQRRNLIDELLVTTHPEALGSLHDFKKALRTRNKILKNHQQGLATRPQTQALLESLNPSYYRLAAELTKLRLEAIDKLSFEFENTMRKLISDDSVDISVEYVVSGTSAKGLDLEKVTNIMRQRGSELADAELAMGSSLVGPQKHQISFLYNQNNSRIFCSQGQQRALILAFKIAQIVYHRRVRKTEPVLMLDDVLSELDPEKRSGLISFLKENKSQVFITTTDVSLPDSMSDSALLVQHIENGEIVRTSKG